jgi:hypothetical protein
MDADDEYAIVLGTGERSMSLDAVWRAASYGDVIGLDTCCFSSDGKMTRFDGRRFSTFSVV